MKLKCLFVLSAATFVLVGMFVLRNYRMELGMRALNSEKGVDAIEIFEPLAYLGDTKAQYLMGDIYAHGWAGVPKNDVVAIYWFRRAAFHVTNESDPAAPVELEIAKTYANGQNSNAIDKQESLKWLRLAAAGGSKEAATLLGRSRPPTQ